jgi:putative Holliday junction resolvase
MPADQQPTRWLCVDHGAVRTGLALGNSADGIASPLEVLSAGGMAAAEAIVRAARDWGVDGIVVGLPLNMDQTEGPQAKLARELAAELARRSGLDVRLWDERLSSFQADQRIAGKYTRKERRKRQDAVAAATILEDFFAADGPRTAPGVLRK